MPSVLVMRYLLLFFSEQFRVEMQTGEMNTSKKLFTRVLVGPCIQRVLGDVWWNAGHELASRVNYLSKILRYSSSSPLQFCMQIWLLQGLVL